MTMPEPDEQLYHQAADAMIGAQGYKMTARTRRELAAGWWRRADFRRAVDEGRRPLLDLLRELVDDGNCWYDHHGYCQGHNLHPRPCPHGRAKALLGEVRPMPEPVRYFTKVANELLTQLPAAQKDGRWPACLTLIREVGPLDAHTALVEFEDTEAPPELAGLTVTPTFLAHYDHPTQDGGPSRVTIIGREVESG